MTIALLAFPTAAELLSLFYANARNRSIVIWWVIVNLLILLVVGWRVAQEIRLGFKCSEQVERAEDVDFNPELFILTTDCFPENRRENITDWAPEAFVLLRSTWYSQEYG